MSKIAVFGLGYVGTVSAACLAGRGHDVIGVDVNPAKVDAVRAGKSPVIEHGVDELLAAGVAQGALTATSDVAAAVRAADVSLICVGTPSDAWGGLDLKHVLRVTAEIGSALRGHDAYHVMAFRSTMLPGTVERRLLPALTEASGRTPGRDLGVAMNPEFLREGTSIADFHHPSRTVIGELDTRSGDAVAALYAGIDAPMVRVGIRMAEMVKYTDNTFHALKIAFANEIGNICKQEGLDSHTLSEVFCLDTKLNLSPAYLKAGFAFGGSCLPKDLRAIIHYARHQNLRVPLLESILASNEEQKRIGLEMVLRMQKRRIGILGLSFKPGTDDLRESPAVELAERLIGKGLEVAIYDQHVSLARLVGANREYIEREIPHISRLMRGTVDEVLADAEVLVVTRKDPEFAAVTDRLRPGQVLIDLVRLAPAVPGVAGYQGICW